MKFDDRGLFHMDEAELVQVFSVAFSRMLERDAELFSARKPQERTFMFRFAHELAVLFAFAENYRQNGKPVLSLDVEYNRDGSEVKTPHGIVNSDQHRWIAPDIILHERGSKVHGYRNDIFVCEMKKKDLPFKEDSKRIRAFLKLRKYKFGIDFYHFTEQDYAFDLYQRDYERHRYVFDRNEKAFRRTDLT